MFVSTPSEFSFSTSSCDSNNLVSQDLRWQSCIHRMALCFHQIIHRGHRWNTPRFSGLWVLKRVCNKFHYLMPWTAFGPEASQRMWRLVMSSLHLQVAAIFSKKSNCIISEEIQGNQIKPLVSTHLPLDRPWPPMRIHVPSTTCDVISFNSHVKHIFQTIPEWAWFGQGGRTKSIKLLAIKKLRQEKRKREGEKAKRKSQLLKPKTSKFCFPRMPELRKLIFCIWHLSEVREVHDLWTVLW